jgi:hypothetical protein
MFDAYGVARLRDAYPEVGRPSGLASPGLLPASAKSGEEENLNTMTACCGLRRCYKQTVLSYVMISSPGIAFCSLSQSIAWGVQCVHRANAGAMQFAGSVSV